MQHANLDTLDILLTVPLLDSDFLADSLPPISTPLIKLTDFGLSRFIDPVEPLLSTRCGSEAYAAPELVISGGRRGVASSSVLWGISATVSNNTGNKGYDARETDAWACGIVLYALVARQLPFGEGPGQAFTENGIRGEAGRGASFVSATERRQWLMKIARGDWVWPESPPSPPLGAVENNHVILQGATLSSSVGARRIVEKLLVRDPSRRSRIIDLLSDDWMDVSRNLIDISHEVVVTPPDPPGSPGIREEHIYLRDDSDEEEDEDEDEDDAVDPGGYLVDSDSIHSIARQEVH
jgi:protein-serine/threonine kinase